jgi:uncharacterized membrane protein
MIEAGLVEPMASSVAYAWARRAAGFLCDIAAGSLISFAIPVVITVAVASYFTADSR